MRLPRRRFAGKAFSSDRIAGMNWALVVYLVLCFAVGGMWLEIIDFHRWRWSIADLLKVTLLVGVLLALGRILASG